MLAPSLNILHYSSPSFVQYGTQRDHFFYSITNNSRYQVFPVLSSIPWSFSSLDKAPDHVHCQRFPGCIRISISWNILIVGILPGITFISIRERREDSLHLLRGLSSASSSHSFFVPLWTIRSTEAAFDAPRALHGVLTFIPILLQLSAKCPM